MKQRPVGRMLGLSILLGFVGFATSPISWAEEKEPKVAEAATYVGDLKGAPAGSKVAVVVYKDDVTAYVCSSDQSFNTNEARWYTCKLNGAKCSATSDGKEFAAEFKDNKCHVAIQSGTTKYTAEAAEVGDADAGLYRLEDKIAGETRVVGWIRTADGKMVGAAQIGAAKKIQQAPVDLTGNRLPLIGNKVVIKTVTSVPQSGPGGENRDFKVTWDASVFPGNEILSFEASLTANYNPTTNNPPITKQLKNLGEEVRSADFRVPEISSQFAVTSFTTTVSAIVKPGFVAPSPRPTPPRNFRVTATKSGTP